MDVRELLAALYAHAQTTGTAPVGTGTTVAPAEATGPRAPGAGAVAEGPGAGAAAAVVSPGTEFLLRLYERLRAGESLGDASGHRALNHRADTVRTFAPAGNNSHDT